MELSLSLLLSPIILLNSLTQIHKKEIGHWNVSNQRTSITTNITIKDTTIPVLSFSNYTWYIKSGTATPGPNQWIPNNAFVDSLGRLHLRITYDSISKSWGCAEIWTTEPFGFGTYEWLVEGPLDKLDKNIVLGLFNYPASPKVPDGTNEIDIEYAKWGIETNKAGNFTVWPASLINGYTNQTYSFKISQSSPKTTQRFSWSTSTIVFQSFNGWDMHNDSLIASKSYTSKNPTFFIPQTAEPVHLNLWLFRGLPPSNNEPVEIIIDKFQKYQ